MEPHDFAEPVRWCVYSSETHPYNIKLYAEAVRPGRLSWQVGLHLALAEIFAHLTARDEPAEVYTGQHTPTDNAVAYGFQYRPYMADLLVMVCCQILGPENEVD